MSTLAHELIEALARLEPAVQPRFRGPASAEAIRQAELELGVALDRDLVEFLMQIDGQEPDGYGFSGDPIIPQFRFGPGPVHFSGWGWLAGIERIVEYTKWYRDFAGQNEDEVYTCLGPASFHRDYIMLTGSENATAIGMDLQPLPGGVFGQVVAINDQPNHVVVLAPSFREFVRRIVDGYQSGRFIYEGGIWTER